MAKSCSSSSTVCMKTPNGSCLYTLIHVCVLAIIDYGWYLTEFTLLAVPTTSPDGTGLGIYCIYCTWSLSGCCFCLGAPLIIIIYYNIVYFCLMNFFWQSHAFHQYFMIVDTYDFLHKCTGCLGKSYSSFAVLSSSLHGSYYVMYINLSMEVFNHLSIL